MVSKTAIDELRAELAERGLFEHRAAAGWIKFLTMLAIFAGLTMAVVLAPWWCAILLVPAAAVPAITAAMIGHEAAHGGFAKRHWHNELMLHVAYPLFAGLSVVHWKYKHNERHHTNPNVVGLDDDICQWPLAMSSDAYKASPGWLQWWQRNLQGLMFWPMCAMLPMYMRFDAWVFLARQGLRGQLTRAWISDCLAMLGHVAIWFIVPSLFVGPLAAILFYVSLWCVAGVLLGLILAPGHLGLPLVSRAGDPQELQLLESRSLVVPRGVSFFFVGLDYQAEHHLFPELPHGNLKQVRPIVREWCARHRLPHLETPFWTAVAEVTRGMRDGWKTEPIDLSTHGEPDVDSRLAS